MTLCKPEIVRFLSSEVVPCWESLGTVPRVTIELGNGRVLRRTLGGNIVMYLAAPDGRVVDAYPGVYTAGDFLAEVQPGMEFLRLHHMNPDSREILALHRQRVEETVHSEVLRTTLSKALVESPLLKALGAEAPPDAPARDSRLAERDYAGAFRSLSARLRDVSKVPASAQQLRTSLELPAGNDTGERAVQLDSRNNRIIVRPAVHLYFAGLRRLPELWAVRDAIYRDILHVPIGDPYLGLADVLLPGTK